VGFTQRTADLAQQVRHATRRLRAVGVDDALQVDAVQVFHRVVKTPSGVRP
jgi:hypothetical protein